MSGQGGAVLYEVRIPMRASSQVTFTSGSEQWRLISTEFRVPSPSSDGTKEIVTVPGFMTEAANAVDDVVAYTWQNGRLLPQCGGRVPKRGCLVLLVESPHRSEYDRSHRPRQPLNNGRTRRRIETDLPGVILQAQRDLGRNFDGCDVVLSNPVRFQASLHRLMDKRELRKRPKGRRGLQRDVRDETWLALFGTPEIRDDFRSRIASYEPALIILAPTRGVEPTLLDFVRGQGWRYVRLDSHPSAWMQTRPPKVLGYGP